MPFENDNTKVTIKEKQFPIKREFNYTTPVVTQGRPLSKTEKEASDKKLKQQEQIQKEQKDLQQGLEAISAAVDYTSPSYWINRNGGDLNTADALGVDFLTYLAIGGLSGLVKQGAVKLSKKGIQKTAKFYSVNAATSTSDKVKALSGNWNPAFKWNTGKPTGPVNYEVGVTHVRNRLIEWYNSPEYRNRLKQAGFTDQQAEERISQLIANSNVRVIDGQLNPHEYGLTSINLQNEIPVSVTIDGKQLTNQTDFNSTVLEELLHASELNGLTAIDLKQAPEFFTLPQKQQKLLLDNVNRLHNDVAFAYNAQNKPTYFNLSEIEQLIIKDSPDPQATKAYLDKMSFSDKQQCLLNAASYYNLPHESRARAIGSLLNDPRMSIEWIEYGQTHHKKSYLETQY